MEIHFTFYTLASRLWSKIRFLALGDCGSGYIQQYNVKAAINYYNKNNYINGILLLGDNAYVSGVQMNIKRAFFNPYKTNFILSTLAFMHHRVIMSMQTTIHYLNHQILL